MDWSLALPIFLITLREGVEAALVVGIVLACLSKAGQTQFNSWVFAGIGAGLAGSVGVGGLLSRLLLGLKSSNRPNLRVLEPLLSAGFGLVAIALLSWMLIWMTQQAGSVKSEISQAVSSSFTQNQPTHWGIFSLVGIAVLREGFETVVFVLAQFQPGWMPVLGGLGGILGAVLIGFMLFRWGIQINLSLFFRVMGVMLLIIVSGLVVSTLKDLDQALLQLSQVSLAWKGLCGDQIQDACILGPRVWNTHAWLPDREFPGILLKTLFGYRERLYLVQAIAYILYIVTMGWLYFQSLKGPAPLGQDSD
jgi:high-affinity iron transporter